MGKYLIILAALPLFAAISIPTRSQDTAQKPEPVKVAVTVTLNPNGTVSVDGVPTAGTSGQPASPALVATAKPSEDGKPYTSVIIDTTGFKLDRCMSPKIRRISGAEVWGTVPVDLDYAEEVGIVGYAKSMAEARNSPRCGSNPMVMTAIGRAGGKFYSDPVISDPDAALLLSEDTKGGFLKKFNVIFVKDGKL